MLLASEVLSVIDRAVRPALLTLSMLKVVKPLALVLGSIHVDVDACAICLIVDPVTLIDVTIDVSELSNSVRPVVLPVTLVLGAVGPDLLSEAIAEAANPLARVLRIRPVGVGGSLLAGRIWVVRCIRDGLS